MNIIKSILTKYYIWLWPLLKLLPYTWHKKFLVCLLNNKKIVTTSSATARTFILADLRFRNRLGLGAGFDINADYITKLKNSAFGFIEIGTVTPEPQNILTGITLVDIKAQTIRYPNINCNKGVEYLYQKLHNINSDLNIGVNIAKNLHTPIEKMNQDFNYCLQRLYTVADYFVFNINCELSQEVTNLIHIWEATIDELLILRNKLRQKHQKSAPILIKLCANLPVVILGELVHICLHYGVDGIVVQDAIIQQRTGLLIGGVTNTELAVTALKKVVTIVKGGCAIIATGGILDPLDAKSRFNIGADLVQLHSGLYFFGPKLLTAIEK